MRTHYTAGAGKSRDILELQLQLQLHSLAKHAKLAKDDKAPGLGK
jgi:hypothetical protein